MADVFDNAASLDTPKPSYWASKRKLQVYNHTAELNGGSGETIPGYGLVYLDVDNGAGWFGTQGGRDDVVFLVGKPNASAVDIQDPALLAVNGPIPIPPGRRGVVTQDWPAQVLHYGFQDGLPNGWQCGPKADSWGIWSGGTAFTCITHDQTDPVHSINDGVDPHTVWIAAGRKNGIIHTAARIAGTFAAGKQITFQNLAPATNADGNGSGQAPLTSVNTNGQITIKKAGRFWIMFSGVISSLTAREGNALRVRVYKNDVATEYTAHRKQTIGTSTGVECFYGGPPVYTEETVVIQGPLDLKAGDVLTVKNAGSDTIVVSDCVFGCFEVGLARTAPALLTVGG